MMRRVSRIGLRASKTMCFICSIVLLPPKDTKTFFCLDPPRIDIFLQIRVLQLVGYRFSMPQFG